MSSALQKFAYDYGVIAVVLALAMMFCGFIIPPVHLTLALVATALFLAAMAVWTKAVRAHDGQAPAALQAYFNSKEHQRDMALIRRRPDLERLAIAVAEAMASCPDCGSQLEQRGQAAATGSSREHYCHVCGYHRDI